MTNDGLSNGDWKEHRRLILYRFDAIDAQLRATHERLDKIESRLATIEARVYAMGGAAGVVGFVLAAIFDHFVVRR